MPRVLFLTQTPETGAAARYRVYQYLDYLKAAGIDFGVSPSTSAQILENYLESPNLLNKFKYYSSIICKRISRLLSLSKYELIFLQRDMIIHAYPFIEKLIALRQKKIIFDFDDAIYLYPTHVKKGIVLSLFWDKKKIERIIKLSNHVIVGNNFLRKYAENFTKNVTVIPTSVDLDLYNRRDNQSKDITGKITIGWIGSQGTFSYLKDIFTVFVELAKKYDIELKVIGANGPKVNGLRINYKDWSLDTEIEDIYSFDIGVMPLMDDEWSRGKSATKLLQYMAAGVPAVASSVGVNREIIKDGINSFLADSFDEWIQKISYIIENKSRAEQMGLAARKTVEDNYSTAVNAPKLMEVIEKVLKET